MSKEKPIRLDRLLSNLGYGSRKEMAIAIRNGWLDIDGERVKDPSQDIELEMVRSGRVLFDSQILDPLSPLTVMLNKPAGYTCSHKDTGNLIYELLPERWKQRKPVMSTIGRLDKDTTGQLLLTDDGDLLHRIIHPKSDVKKHYKVTLRDSLKGNETELFESGTFMLSGEDKPLNPAIWKSESDKSGVMTLLEGRFRQIRRMFESLGNEVVLLHRFQTGSLALGDLAEGQWKALSSDDIANIFKG